MGTAAGPAKAREVGDKDTGVSSSPHARMLREDVGQVARRLALAAPSNHTVPVFSFCDPDPVPDPATLSILTGAPGLRAARLDRVELRGHAHLGPLGADRRALPVAHHHVSPGRAAGRRPALLLFTPLSLTRA